MKRLLLLVSILSCSAAATYAQAVPSAAVTKNPNTGQIKEDLTFGTGRMLTLASGSTLNASAATVTLPADVTRLGTSIDLGTSEATGTLATARLPATLPALSGVNLTALNATQLTSGTLPRARLDADLLAEHLAATRQIRADADLIAGGLLTMAPSTGPSARQRAFEKDKFGVFIHFGLASFHSTSFDWSAPEALNTYAPTQLDPDQWVRLAAGAGARYVILVTKHHNGFCLWPTSQTSYSVANTSYPRDVVGEVAAACRRYGVKLALYYSLWDRNQNPNRKDMSLDAAYAGFMRAQLTELCTRYGDIAQIWLDGGWAKTEARWEYPSLYDTIRRLQPQCIVINNSGIGPKQAGFTYAEDGYGSDSNASGYGKIPSDMVTGDAIKLFPSEVASSDPYTPVNGNDTTSAAGQPKLYSNGGQTYYLPFQTTTIITDAPGQEYLYWFWHADSPAKIKSTAQLVDEFCQSTGQSNNFVLNIPPDNTGRIDEPHARRMMEFARAAGLAPGAPIQDLAEGKPTTASSAYPDPGGYYTNTYVASRATDGLTGTRWSANTGDTAGAWLEVDLGSVERIDRVMVDEAPAYKRITACEVRTYYNGVWTTVVKVDVGGGLVGLTYRLFSFPPVSASKVRFVVVAATAEPTIRSLRIYAAPDVVARTVEITSSVTYYASPSGSDASDGLTSATAKSLRGAIEMVSGKVLNSGVVVTIQLADGTYTGAVTAATYQGAGRVRIVGNTTTPGNVVLTRTGGDVVNIATTSRAPWELAALRITGTGGHLVHVRSGWFLLGDKLEFGSVSDYFAQVDVEGPASTAQPATTCTTYTLSGGGGTNSSHVRAEGGATYFWYDETSAKNVTVNFGGSARIFGEFMKTLGGSRIVGFGTITTTNGSITGKRYSASGNSVILWYGATGLDSGPGSSAGTLTTGGVIDGG